MKDVLGNVTSRSGLATITAKHKYWLCLAFLGLIRNTWLCNVSQLILAFLFCKHTRIQISVNTLYTLLIL